MKKPVQTTKTENATLEEIKFTSTTSGTINTTRSKIPTKEFEGSITTTRSRVNQESTPETLPAKNVSHEITSQSTVPQFVSELKYSTVSTEIPATKTTISLLEYITEEAKNVTVGKEKFIATTIPAKNFAQSTEGNVTTNGFTEKTKSTSHKITTQSSTAPQLATES